MGPLCTSSIGEIHLRLQKLCSKGPWPILRFKFYGIWWSWGHMGTKTLIIGSWGVEGEECVEWGGFGSQGIRIVLCDRAWASHQVLGWLARTRFSWPCCHDSRVLATGDVQDKKYRQAVTSAGTGLSTSFVSPLHYLYFDFGTSMFAPLLWSSFYLGSCVLCRE